jgi:acyl-CoA synthetase (NDP forming)
MNRMKETINRMRNSDRKSMNPEEMGYLLELYGIAQLKYRYETDYSKENVITSANRIGYPVAVKLASEKILHKSDSGCVQLNLKSDEEVSSAYDEILKNAGNIIDDEDIDGVLIQEMSPFDHEVIVGLGEDPTFGKIVLFGVGGIFVELLKDVSIRKVPIDRLDAKDMIEEIKGIEILKGARGKSAADFEKLYEILLNVSQIGAEIDDIGELDLNPILVDSKRAVVADSRVIIKGRDV